MNKYHNMPVWLDNHVFPSRREARRYQELIALQAAGLIRDLELQPEYEIIVNGVKICVYKGDFRYFDCEQNERITEDTKGVATAVYKLKKKLVKALYGVDIKEV